MKATSYRRIKARMAATAAWLGVALIAAGSAQAQQSYPNHAIRIVVGFTPGGPTDLVARSISDKMSAQMGQSVFVDNRPGAGGLIGLDLGLKSGPDGYTLTEIASPTLISAMLLGRQWSTDRDMVPIGLAYRQGFFIGLNPTRPEFHNVKNIVDLVKAIKANPGKISFASIGTGSTGHLTGELMKAEAGLDWQHVPYKGTAPALQELVAGQASIVFFGTSYDDPNKFPGRLVNVGITSARHDPHTPEVPSLAESGFPSIDATTWLGFVVPPGTPRPIVERLASEYKKAWENPETQARLTMSINTEYMAPTEFGTLLRQTVETWGKVIKDNNIHS